jgi:hypothetical protein
MDKTISLSLELNPKDFADASKSLDEQFFRTRHITVIAPLAVFFIFVFTICLTADSEINIVGVILFSLIPALILWVALLSLYHFSSLIAFRKMKRSTNSSPAAHDNLQINFSDEGIEFVRVLFSAKWNWLVFTKAIETEKEILLYMDDAQKPFFIPKRAFVSDEDLNFVKCLMRTKLVEKAQF